MKIIIKRRLTQVLIAFTFLSFNVTAQNFTGKIVYTVEMLDTNVQTIIDAREMTVYTNDTLSRIITQNDALGEQVTIKHLALNKSYLLMTMLGKNIAIKTDSSSDTSKVDPYQIRYKFFGRKKVNGFILKKAVVNREDLETARTIWYFKNIRPDVMDMYEGIKGLPADFYIATVDGIVHYSLKSIENTAVDKDLFGIPSDYEKITLDEFMMHVRQPQND